MSSATLDGQGVITTCPQCGQQNRQVYDRLGDAVRCARCKTMLPEIGAPIDIDSTEHFDALVRGASVPIVVDYWAPWCGPCRMVAPELAKVAARQAGKLIVAKVNTDELMDLGRRFGIMSIPTMAVFAGGQELERTSGARPASDIETFVAHATAKART